MLIKLRLLMKSASFLENDELMNRWGPYVKLQGETHSRLKLWKARSRLYRRRFLQPNTHFAAFFEIFKIYKPLHLSIFKICWLFLSQNFAKFQWISEIFRKILLKSPKICYFSPIFSRIFAGISQNVRNFDGLDVANFKIPDFFEKMPNFAETFCRNSA